MAKAFSPEEIALQRAIASRIPNHSGKMGFELDLGGLTCPNGHTRINADRASALGEDLGHSFQARCEEPDCAWNMQW
jgi:hypothetical protein